MHKLMPKRIFGKIIALLALHILAVFLAHGQIEKPDLEHDIAKHLKQSFKKLPAVFQIDSVVSGLMTDPEKRVQLIIEKRQANGSWQSLVSFPEPMTELVGYKHHYFYPASLVKLPTMIAVMRKLNQLKIKNWQSLTFSIGNECGCTNFRGHKSKQKQILIDQFRRICLYSDNQAYNALYDIAGRAYINQCLQNWGYQEAVVGIRFAGCSKTQHRKNNSVRLFSGNQFVVKQLALNDVIRPVKHVGRFVGRAHIKDGKLHNAPADFSQSSNLDLKACHDLLGKIIDKRTNELGITNAQADSLIRWLGQTPKESPLFATISQPFRHDAVKKYLYYGARLTTQVSTNKFRIVNIVGQSHGWLSDIAYFKSNDLDTADIRVSCVLMVNKDGIIGSGNYQTLSGMKFLQQIGFISRKLAAINDKN